MLTSFSPEQRKKVLKGILLIALASITINSIAGIVSDIMYRVMDVRQSAELVTRSLKGITVTVYIASYAVPSTLATIYTWPHLMVALGRGGEKTLMVARRRTLNGPLIVALCGATGWAAYDIVFFYGMYINGLPLISFGSLRVIVDSAFNAAMCFVFSYYATEYITRLYYIPVLFQDGRLSHCEGAFALTIRERLMIYFFSVSLFPLLMYLEVFFAMMNNYNGRISMSGIGILTGGIVVLGIMLTILVSMSYRVPLRHMRKAAESVGKGDYQVSVPVVSNDETGMLSEAMNDMAAGLREKEFIKDTFGRMVDPAVRDHLLGGNAGLGGRIIEITVLFTDIRGFTTMSENMPPDEIVELLNRYFELLGPCVAEEGGIVNKFIGDSMMAIFGAPAKLDDHPAAAVRAARRMSSAMETLNTELTAKGRNSVAHGVGIHTGPALLGNIGTGTRMEYTAIGDTVNTASRIQGLCKQYKKEILISETTVEKLNHGFNPKLIGEAEIRGRNRAVKVFTL